jgi:hypothetical protein
MKSNLLIICISITSLFTISACGNTENESKMDVNEHEVVSEDSPIDYSKLEVNITLYGQILGATNQKLTLEALSNKGTIQLATAKTTSDGHFTLKGNIQGMGLYQLKLGNNSKIIPLTLEPDDSIKISADYKTFERKPILSGSLWAETMTKYMQKFNEFAEKQSLLMLRKELSQEQQIQEFLKLRKPLDAFAKEEMLKNPANPANIVLSTSMTPAMGFELSLIHI